MWAAFGVGAWGRRNTDALKLFFAQHIQPCLDTEPGHPVQHRQIERLMQFMMDDPNTTSLDAALVRNIITGRLSRHPAYQGVLIGCITKIKNMEEGRSTMRNRHRDLANDVQGRGSGSKLMRRNLG